jgi:hypothetical protein
VVLSLINIYFVGYCNVAMQRGLAVKGVDLYSELSARLEIFEHPNRVGFNVSQVHGLVEYAPKANVAALPAPQQL